MKLTSSPFNPQTGELLPVYRDAYLHGDLSRESARAVESYLQRDANQAHSTLTRWQELHAAQEASAAPNWVQRQVQYIRAEPVRFRRRASVLVASAVLVGTVVFAGINTPTERLPADNLPTETALAPVAEASAAEASSALRMVTVRGLILDENGAPLVGATVMHPGSQYGVSTNSKGEYVLAVPASTSALKVGYGGYQDDEVTVQGTHAANVTLLPRHESPEQLQAPAKKRRWLFF